MTLTSLVGSFRSPNWRAPTGQTLDARRLLAARDAVVAEGALVGDAGDAGRRARTGRHEVARTVRAGDDAVAAADAARLVDEDDAVGGAVGRADRTDRECTASSRTACTGAGTNWLALTAAAIGPARPAKPLLPASGDSTITVPPAVDVRRSTQVRVCPTSSGTSFSVLHATTHLPQPMHCAVSTTKPQRWAVGVVAGDDRIDRRRRLQPRLVEPVEDGPGAKEAGGGQRAHLEQLRGARSPADRADGGRLVGKLRAAASRAMRVRIPRGSMGSSVMGLPPASGRWHARHIASACRLVVGRELLEPVGRVADGALGQAGQRVRDRRVALSRSRSGARGRRCSRRRHSGDRSGPGRTTAGLPGVLCVARDAWSLGRCRQHRHHAR